MAGQSYEGFRRFFQDASVTKTVLAATAPTTTLVSLIAVRNASYTIFVQRITWNVSTSHSDTIVFQDDASTPLVLTETIASPALGHVIVFDAGPKGFPLTEGKDLDGVGGAGPAGVVSVEAYQKLTAIIAHNATSQ